MFVNPPESVSSNVAEEPACHRVERMASLSDMRFCLAVETLSVCPCVLILSTEK